MLVESVLRLTDDKGISVTDNKPRKAVIKKAGS